MRDYTSFERIYLATKDALYGYVKKFISNNAEAKDVVQECYIKLWLKADSLTNIDDPKPFLFKCARDIMVDMIRKSSSEKKYIKHYQHTATVVIDYSKEAAQKEIRKQVIEVVESLPAKKKLIFKLKEEGLSHKEIAGHLNISTKAVEKHLTEIIRTLRKLSLTKPDLDVISILLFTSCSFLSQEIFI